MMAMVPSAQARGPRVPGVVKVYSFNSSPAVKALLLKELRGSPLCLKLGGAKSHLQNIDRNVQYTVIGMSTLDCSDGTGLGGLSNRFITLNDVVIFTISPTGIEVKGQ
ncbi:hypothetical protein XarbCFBP7408_13265 [Xanthomonas arboricola pv. guizotiae]|nr:hypothetical protein XarbCFBP7408_13265 [Xanthomonas arboricola pv. guizotiae]